MKRAIGLAHSGWRGTVKKIGKKTVEAMADAFGTNPQDIHAAVGPSICQDCYEVSEDVIWEFRKAFPDMGEDLHGICRPLWYPAKPGKYQLDLWEANRQVMLEAGISEDKIEVTDLCTCCNPDVLFSHRASEGKRGNLGAFMRLG